MDDAKPVLPMEVLAYATPALSPSRWPARLGWLAVIACWLSLSLIAVVSVETVLASGPTLFCIGIALVVVAAIGRRWPLFLIGIGHLGVCALCMGLVNAFHWSPGDSLIPFSIIGLLWATLATVGTALHEQFEEFVFAFRHGQIDLRARFS